MNAVRRQPRPNEEGKTAAAILIVEDEMLVRMAIADRLRNAGYAVIETANADAALEVLRRGDHVRLIMSDIRMPGAIDGAELARRVRSLYPHIRIVLVSGHAGAVDRAPHDGFFRKPYDIEKMIRHINALMA